MTGMPHSARGRARPKSNWHDYHATESSGYPTVTEAGSSHCPRAVRRELGLAAITGPNTAETASVSKPAAATIPARRGAANSLKGISAIRCLPTHLGLVSHPRRLTTTVRQNLPLSHQRRPYLAAQRDYPDHP